MPNLRSKKVSVAKCTKVLKAPAHPGGRPITTQAVNPRVEPEPAKVYGSANLEDTR